MAKKKVIDRLKQVLKTCPMIKMVEGFYQGALEVWEAARDHLEDVADDDEQRFEKCFNKTNERQFELPLGDNQREYPKIVVGAER